MSSICRLCGQVKPLQESHIIPKFVFDWMKKTGSGYIRVSGNPNKREQDGQKQALLCFDCEQLFGNREKWFSEHIFVPYIDNAQITFAYDATLFYFLLSVLWRVLIDTVPALETAHPYRTRLELADMEWRTYLLGGQLPPTYNEVHLFFTDVGLQEGTQPVVNFSRYFARSVDFTIASGQSRCCVYAKFARFICFGAITPFDPQLFVGTRVYPNGGTLSVPQSMLDGNIGEFMADRARSAYEASITGLSEKQKQVISAEAIKKADRIAQNDLGKAILADHEAIVDPLALWPKVDDVSRCPCGSGKTFLECHGRKKMN